MNRKEAIHKIALEMLKDFPDGARREIVEDVFISGYEAGDSEIETFKQALKAEIFAGVEPENPMEERYDPIIIDSIEFGFIGVKNGYIIEKLHSLGIKADTIEGEVEKLEECPCCGFLTLSQRGQYDICKVCFWEDDGANNDNDYSGPNHITLGEGRENYKEYGACDEEAKKFIDPEGALKFYRNHS